MLIEIVGKSAKEIISSGDDKQDAQHRAHFVKRYEEMHRLFKEPDGTTTLYVGVDNWPTPMAIVKKATCGTSMAKPRNRQSFSAGSERMRSLRFEFASNWPQQRKSILRCRMCMLRESRATRTRRMASTGAANRRARSGQRLRRQIQQAKTHCSRHSGATISEC